jgi:asparagine synthase (glutamine-hydrolysing)
MSGIVGILQMDGAPVNAALLQRLTDSLAFRGPDANRIWTGGAVGFGHTLLRATREADHEQQPAGLDGTVWITADARVDARSELIEKLRAAGREIATGVADAEIILHAYVVWGRSCVDHLIGDFAFVIWDGAARRLFCARDHFGVKPFYYSRVGNSLIFSNSLNCLRLHPGLSDTLNDLAIADFLLFDFNQDLGTTSFAHIQRLPPAHTLYCEQENIRVQRYWTLPIPEQIRYQRSEEYIEHFGALLDAAVEDRLRAQTAGVMMSGGLDSSTVAAHAQRVFSRRGNTTGLHAYTEVFDRLIPHEERHYAGLVAKALGIPIHYRADDDSRLYDLYDDPAFNWPEPIHSPWGTSSVEQLREISAGTSVVLTGFGADPAFSSRISIHFRQLLKKKEFGRALADAASYVAAEGRFSRLYVRTRWRLLFKAKGKRPWFPAWFNKDLEKRLRLRDRWEEIDRSKVAVGAVRPVAYESIVAPLWTNLFEFYDPSVTRVPVEVSHPYFDLRLLSFLLALPALPWSADKELLRQAGGDALPKQVRLRRKSPLAADPLLVLLQRPESAWVDRFEAAPALQHFVIRSAIPSVLGEKDVWKAWIHLRPLSLNLWLRRILPVNTLDGL